MHNLRKYQSTDLPVLDNKTYDLINTVWEDDYESFGLVNPDDDYASYTLVVALDKLVREDGPPSRIDCLLAAFAKLGAEE